MHIALLLDWVGNPNKDFPPFPWPCCSVGVWQIFFSSRSQPSTIRQGKRKNRFVISSSDVVAWGDQGFCDLLRGRKILLSMAFLGKQ